MALFEICRGSEVLASSHIPGLGYPPELLRQMERDGYTVRVDGAPRPRRSRKPENAEAYCASFRNMLQT